MSLLHPHLPLARITAFGLALFTMVTVSGCGSQAGAISPPSHPPTPVSSPTASAVNTPAAPAVSTPAATPAQAGSPSRTAAPVPAALVLAPTGIGGLSLGMSKSAALATGMIAGPDAKVQGSTECRVYDGRHGVDLVYFSGSKVKIISVRSSVRTDKGVGVGGTYLTLHQQYPDALDSDDSGRAFAVAQGAAVKAHYRFGVSGTHSYPDSKITSIALQSDDQPCYE